MMRTPRKASLLGALAAAAVTLLAVVSGCSSSSDDHFSCSLNGTCYKCPSSDAVSKCSLQTGPGPGCEKAEPDYCKK